MTSDSHNVDISVVVVNWNTRELLKNCLASIADTAAGLAYEIIVVDNASQDGSQEMVRQFFPNVRLIANDENKGFGVANNQALRMMGGRYALLLNSDTILTSGAIRELLSFMDGHAEAGMVCGQLLNSDGSKQHSFASFPTLFSLMMNTPFLEYLFPQSYPSKRYQYNAPIEVDSAIGACMLVRKTAMDNVGLFDERYFFFFEETDWAYRMKQAGWKVFHVPAAKIYHLQGQSIGPAIRSRIEFYRSRYQFFQKWHGPAYFLAVRAVIFGRLLVNWTLTTLTAVATLGLSRSIRSRQTVYTKLVQWHFSPDFFHRRNKINYS